MEQDPLASLDALREPLMADHDEEDAVTESSSRKGKYDLVSRGDDDNDDEVDEEDEADEIILPSSSRWQRILHATLVPDDQFTVCETRILDGPFAIKLLKLLIVAYLGIVSMFYLVRFMEWENDGNYHLADFWVYEANLVAADVVVFFLVGRLHRQRGVDHLAWLMTVLLANVYSSSITTINFLQHSFTLYEMHCLWSWKLWAFAGIMVPLIVSVIVLHLRQAIHDRVLVQKLIELLLCCSLFLFPLLSSPYFHFHHWFLGWLVGMHANFDVWWGRATMAWCFGLYINGIAVYGRDPVLTCGYAYFLSVDQHCPYIDCYLKGMQSPSPSPNNITQPPVTPMIPPDWMNCSADAYHP